MKDLLKKCIPALCLVPLVIGTIGYYIFGDSITNCLYASVALYGLSPISDAYNGFIEFARWTAPLVTASAILCVLQNAWNNILWRINNFAKDSIAVYSDDKVKISFEKGIKVAYPGDSCKGYFQSHIILFSSDDKSILFYNQNKNELKHKSVYIGLREIEQGLVRHFENVHLFDINGVISRVLWKNIRLWNSGDVKVNIVIYGNSALSRQILLTGLQMNLFSLNQSISYHFVADNLSFALRHHALELMNNDVVLYHGTDSVEAWESIRTADIVIIADQLNCDSFQNIIVNSGGPVYYYSPFAGDIGDRIEFGRVIPFGRDEEVFTDDNIRNEKLIEKAKNLNIRYASENPGFGKSWDELSGFLKESNISSADYVEVLSQLLGDKEDIELAELEHIRWCRFHYLNYWNYSEQRDNGKRLHNDLKPFGELNEAEKKKDLAAVERVKKSI